MSVPAKELDANGRCCGRKPLVYKRLHGHHHLFCDRCNAAYDPSGHQIENWGWKSVPGGFEKNIFAKEVVEEQK